MYWLVNGIDNLRRAFPKTLIYANSISDVAKLYSYVINELSDCAEFVDMFHSETSDENKSEILSALNENSSTKRVVFATSALGMGIDTGNCQSAILYGPPHSVVDLVQEIGRVGRDGQLSVAIMLYNSHHLRNVDKDVKTLFQSNTCRRKALMGNFLEESQLTQLEEECNLHTCCDICTKSCPCGYCQQLTIEKLFENVDCAESSSDSNTVDYELSDKDYLSSDCEELLEACNEIN
jgi:superfamily II DNA helicase RecQ